MYVHMICKMYVADCKCLKKYYIFTECYSQKNETPRNNKHLVLGVSKLNILLGLLPALIK